MGWATLMNWANAENICGSKFMYCSYPLNVVWNEFLYIYTHTDSKSSNQGKIHSKRRNNVFCIDSQIGIVCEASGTFDPLGTHIKKIVVASGGSGGCCWSYGLAAIRSQIRTLLAGSSMFQWSCGAVAISSSHFAYLAVLQHVNQTCAWCSYMI